MRACKERASGLKGDIMIAGGNRPGGSVAVIVGTGRCTTGTTPATVRC